jgi:multimeric flavodoxin WrbA
MKITVLHGQQHKRNTYKVTQLLLQELATENDEVKEFYVNDIPACAGCFICILKDEHKCPHRSITEPIIEAIEEADVLIAESPNYCMGMTGQLKIFFDHLAYRWMTHRPHPRMRSKIGVAISTAAGGGSKKVTKDIVNQMLWLGFAKTYQVHVDIWANGFDEMKQSKRNKLNSNIRKTAAKIKCTVGKAKPGLKSKFMFFMMGKMQEGIGCNPIDKAFWKENGWVK